MTIVCKSDAGEVLLVTQVARVEQDRMMLEKVTRDNAARLQQKAVAAEQAKLKERR